MWFVKTSPAQQSSPIPATFYTAFWDVGLGWWKPSWRFKQVAHTQPPPKLSRIQEVSPGDVSVVCAVLEANAQKQVRPCVTNYDTYGCVSGTRKHKSVPLANLVPEWNWSIAYAFPSRVPGCILLSGFKMSTWITHRVQAVWASAA